MSAADGRRIEIRGTVQGVGFRPWVVRLARELGVSGAVWNDSAGVIIDAFAPPLVLERFEGELRANPPPAARLTDFTTRAIPAAVQAGFDIRESDATVERRVTIPPDLPTCDACLAELRDPKNRRYRYPFINCTCCGPRYTIVRGLPYDRPETTMASFRMCPSCQREYDEVTDRRYHAQPNACAECGPRLQLVPHADGDPIRLVVDALKSGKVVALKGLGGFHLAVDAMNADAVRLLRERKRRDEKPFAVMVKDLEVAHAVAELSRAEEALLAGVERPVVLVNRRSDSRAIAGNVAPGLSRVGLMLPYTPLHHLLLDEMGTPLVMTSGNLSEEPIAIRNDDALERLGGLADLLLLHDREIEARADDSVAQVVSGRPMLMRRSRGYVSRGHKLPRPVDRPVLACGAQLKNTFCLATGEAAYLSAHVGDLENLETLGAFEEGVARMERLLKIHPEVVAHDLHPDFLSTQYALRRGLPSIAVQHHHAHVVSAMVQHQLQGRVLGLAWDGTGLGTDGTAWGSELLLGGPCGFERLATFRPLPLAGGDLAVREVWRLALAAVDDAFDGSPPLGALELFRQVTANEINVVRQMITGGLNAPLAHGAGRYFDAMGALALARRHARYEGQVAIALEQAADPHVRDAYRIDIDFDVQPWVVDLRPAFRDAVSDLMEGRSAGVVAARFHGALVEAAAEVLRMAQSNYGDLPVVLTGGCFQNTRLSRGVVSALSPDMAVFLHEEIPAGDGGLSIGQAVIADAVARTQS